MILESKNDVVPLPEYIIQCFIPRFCSNVSYGMNSRDELERIMEWDFPCDAENNTVANDVLHNVSTDLSRAGGQTSILSKYRSWHLL